MGGYWLWGGGRLISHASDPVDTLQPRMAKSAFYRDHPATKHTGLGCWPCPIEHHSRLAFQRSHVLDTRKNMVEKRPLLGANDLVDGCFRNGLSTILGEPLLLNVLELTILMVGSLVEGIIIACILVRNPAGNSE